MTRRKALQRWGTRIGNCEVTPQTSWTTAKSRVKGDGQKAPAAIRALSGLKFNRDCGLLEKKKQFTPHDLCGENHERCVQARVQALLESVDNNLLERARMCDVQKLIYFKTERGLWY
jgi:hypothetical protein